MRQGNGSASDWLFASPYADDRSDAVQLVGSVAAILSIGAGVIHVSAAGDHTELPVMFVGFMVVAALEVALGGLLLWRRPSKLLIAAALAMMLGSIGIWILSRTAGLPFIERGHQEPVGFKDGVTKLFELGSIPVLLLLLSRDLARVSLPSPRLASHTLSVLGAACFALMVPALLLGGGEQHSHEEAVALGIHDEDDHGDSHELAQETDTHGSHDQQGTGGNDPGPAHDHAASQNSGGGHQHTDLALTGTSFEPTHDHASGDPHDDAPRHHSDPDHQTDRKGDHHRGDRPKDDEHDGGHHGGGDGEGDEGGGADDDGPVTVSYEPEPSVCVIPGDMTVCFP